MFERIRKYFTLPVLEDEEQTRRARLLITILLVLSLATIVVVGTMVALDGLPRRFADTGPVIATVVIIAATLASFALVRRRFPTGLAIGILSLMWSVVTAWVWFTEGLSGGYTSYIYALLIVLAGLLLGSRGAAVYAALSVIGVVGGIYAEKSGFLPGRAGVKFSDAMIISTSLVMIGVFLRYAMKSMQNAIDRARKAVQAQIAANRELDAIRLSLEERVAARTRDLEYRSIYLQAVIELGRAAASLRELDELVQQAPPLISERLDFYHVGLFLVDENQTFATLGGANSLEGQRLLAQGYHVAVGVADIIGEVTATRRPRVAVDVGPDAVSFAGSSFPRTRSELALPLVAGDRLIGALDLHSVESDVFTAEMVEVMQLLADQIAVAIENAQLFAQSRAALAAELRAYGEVSREAWREMSQVESALRFLTDAPGVVRSLSGQEPAVMRQAQQTGRAITEAGSTLAVPIQVREGVNIGALRLRKAAWGKDDIALVETLTEQLGAALESARLYQETQRREARERITREITDDIRRSVDIETILRSALTNLGDALGVPRTYVRLILEDTDMPSAAPADPDVVLESSLPTAAALDQGEVYYEP